MVLTPDQAAETEVAHLTNALQADAHDDASVVSVKGFVLVRAAERGR